MKSVSIMSLYYFSDLNASMQSLMDRITSLERMLNPVTQPAPRYMPHATAHVNSYSLQRPSVQFGPGNL